MRWREESLSQSPLTKLIYLPIFTDRFTCQFLLVNSPKGFSLLNLLKIIFLQRALIIVRLVYQHHQHVQVALEYMGLMEAHV